VARHFLGDEREDLLGRVLLGDERRHPAQRLLLLKTGT
jgi:hypothetical protein